MSTRLEPNSEIEIQLSTQGEDAVLRIEKLEEYRGQQVTFVVNGTRVTCPKCVEVNGELKPGAYEIQDGDVIEIRSYYTVEQIAEFMDVEVDMTEDVFVNNRSVDMDTRVYDNFTLDWTTLAYAVADAKETDAPMDEEDYGVTSETYDESAENGGEPLVQPIGGPQTIQVYVNNEPVTLTGKREYIFVDIFDYYEFDLKAGNGRGVITQLNGEDAAYVAVLKNGDHRRDIHLF